MALVEKRYAEALVNIAIEQNNIEGFLQDFKGVADIYNNHLQFSAMLLDPEITSYGKKELLKKLFSNEIRSEVMNFLMLLIDKGRMKFMPGIYTSFVKLADENRNVLHMTIISASPLDSIQTEKLTSKYKVIHKAASVNLSTLVQPDLIGGVKVVIGDKVTDGTVMGRLKMLEDLLVAH